MATTFEWTHSEVETVRRMVAEGKSFTQIGNALGRTRCMISGKVHRLGLSYTGRYGFNLQQEETKKRDENIAQLFREGMRESEIARQIGMHHETVHRSLVRSGNKERKIPGEQKQRKSSSRSGPGRPTNGYNFHNGKIRRLRYIYYESMADKPSGPLVEFLDLKPHHCRWPHGDPGKYGFGFCGSPKVDGSPYCAHHSFIAYREPTMISDRERARRSRLGKMQVASGAWSCGFLTRKGDENGLRNRD